MSVVMGPSYINIYEGLSTKGSNFVVILMDCLWDPLCHQISAIGPLKFYMQTVVGSLLYIVVLIVKKGKMKNLVGLVLVLELYRSQMQSV